MTKAKLISIPSGMDEQAFELLFNEHYPKVFAILYHLTGDRFEADDLAAETFHRLWEQPPQRGENLGGWLYRVASRMGYNLLRAKRRRNFYEFQAGQDRLNAQSQSNPENEAERSIERERVRSILRSLSLRETQVLILRHSGLSYKEIADVLKVAPTSIGTLLARAEDRFEKLYRRGENRALKK